MNILSWFARNKKAQQDQAPPERSGPLTGCDLSALNMLALPFAQDPFYRLRPPFSAEAAALSLELANMAYTLDLEPWSRAGWTDASILIDDDLHEGFAHPESGEGLGEWIQKFRLLRAKASMRELNPVSQIRGALRQREKSDTVKAVCMMHPMADGRYLLAVGFMGTGSRFYDWISNLRFSTEEGFHQGFYQLCDAFEQNAETIQFPEVARALGLEKLTLGEVLMEMRSLSSRFRLWMAGHSQGGAVMQVFCHRLMNDWGVLGQNMVGYGFASPTVATGKLVYDPAAYPLYHLFNTDDIVPLAGALVHLGLCLEYPATETMRAVTYEPTADRKAFDLLLPMRRAMTDTPSILASFAALLKCLAEEKGEEGLTELMNRPWAVPFVDRVLTQAGDRAMDWIGRALAGMEAGYTDLTGHALSPSLLRPLCDAWRPIVRQLTVRRLMNAMGSIAAPPHRIVHHDDAAKDGAYAWIVKAGLCELKPFIWHKRSGAAPQKRYAQWTDAGCWPDPIPRALRARRGNAISPIFKSKMRLKR